MSDSRKSATPPKAKSDKERPQRDPESETLEGPGHEEAKDKADATNETTRRGEH